MQISVKKLKTALKRAKCEKPVEYTRPDKSLLSDGARYLYDTLIEPLTCGENVDSRDLDYSKFETDDFEEAMSFCNDYFSGLEKHFELLYPLYKCLIDAPAVTSPAEFI